MLWKCQFLTFYNKKRSGVCWLRYSYPTVDGRHLTSHLRRTFQFSLSFPPPRYPQILVVTDMKKCLKISPEFNQHLPKPAGDLKTKASTNANCFPAFKGKRCEHGRSVQVLPRTLVCLISAQETGAVRGISASTDPAACINTQGSVPVTGCIAASFV